MPTAHSPKMESHRIVLSGVKYQLNHVAYLLERAQAGKKLRLADLLRAQQVVNWIGRWLNMVFLEISSQSSTLPSVNLRPRNRKR